MEHFFRVVGRIIGTLRAENRQLINRYFGSIERFDGNAAQICQQILDRLWEGHFYRTSLGHFDFFWMRDFGTVSASLTRQGYEKRVHHTLKWALSKYRRAGEVTTCIDSFGNTFNAPDVRAIDTLPWLLHSLVVSDYSLNAREQVFLNSQLKKYVTQFLDPHTGMIQAGIVYAEMRDAVIYDRSAYAVAHVGRMARCAKKLDLAFPFDTSIYRAKLINHYWNGEYFRADLRTGAFSAECALFPFWLGVVDDKQLAAKTFDYISSHKLNEPYPMRYTNTSDAFRYRWWMTTPFMPNYAGTSIWSWHGVFYLQLLHKYDWPEYSYQKQKFADMIERHRTWPEMLNADGSWYYAPVYKGDPGMVWVALYLDLTR